MEHALEIFGDYDVVVVGAGASGTVASLRAARQGVRTLLIEASGVLGGLLTGGRLTKPTGLINGGVFRELLARCTAYGGADDKTRQSYWGAYTGAFDAETMQRVIIEAMEEANVEVLLRAPVTGVEKRGNRVVALQIYTKSGIKRVLAKVFIDASGDGDVAALAGASFMMGRPSDGLVQPMTSYFRVINVDMARLAEYCRSNRDDFTDFVIPEGSRNEDFVMKFVVTGLTKRIEQAEADGFSWSIPKDHMTLKSGLIPGEINVNVTRVHGNGLDERQLSRAELEIRKQAYTAFDFLKRYVAGFEGAIFLEVAPKLGVRETRRIKGRYVLTESDVRGEARFADAIGLCNSPVDIHEPGGKRAVMDHVGTGYGIPFRCLIPQDLEGIYVAGRCVSADEVAFGSTRNVPACASTGEAAGAAAAIAALMGVAPSEVPLDAVQRVLLDAGVVLGRSSDETCDKFA